jgi:ElaA protein
MSDDLTLCDKPFVSLTPHELYAVLRLRSQVFVVEQTCPYLDLDGRDAEPSARHLWLADHRGAVLAYVRVLAEPDGARRVGRVVTEPTARGRGLAARLIREALRDWRGDAVLGAQAHLERWYEGFGFTRHGEPYDEDGIPHVPMRRAGR